MTDGVNGYHCEDVGEMVRALDRVDRIDRRARRREFEDRFTARRMALDYMRVYERMVSTAPVAAAQGTEEAEQTAELGGPR